MKKAFALISAVIFVVVIATLGVFALSLANKSASSSVDTYLKEQADVLARSATELAVLAMQKHDYSRNCLNTMTIFYPVAGVGNSCNGDCLFQINVNFKYLDRSMAGSCNVISNTAFDPIIAGRIHPSSHTALINVEVVDRNRKIRVTTQSIQTP